MKKARRAVALFCSLILVVLCATLLKETGAYSIFVYATKNNDLPIYCVDTKEQRLAISFDCAWGTDYTENQS